ncbi:hypothetical protein [uncultured Methanobrevibacter sp.]|uniref:hypothetical protein n=1 Tax=uncultured Methanobrevibacter sp. TaxID=253161 RepID=UPI0025F42681|nr:hypothetical protein [uncultured Methanobrevibacter sp.]
MENKNIIIMLVVIILVLAAVLGAVMFMSFNSKEPVKIVITSNNTLNEGENLTVQLADLNKTAISKQKVNVTVTDSKGKEVVNKAVKTNSKGKATLDLDLKKGKYNVTVSFEGNEKYGGNSTVQKLTIKEATTQSISENTVDMSLYTGYSSAIGSYRVVEHQQELGLLETPGGNYYVMGGDGIYTYAGRDSQGHYQLGSPV